MINLYRNTEARPKPSVLLDVLRQKCQFKGIAIPKAIDPQYQGSMRRIEPYSLRRTKDGNIILHAWNINSDAHRGYRIDCIQGARSTNQDVHAALCG